MRNEYYWWFAHLEDLLKWLHQKTIFSFSTCYQNLWKTNINSGNIMSKIVSSWWYATVQFYKLAIILFRLKLYGLQTANSQRCSFPNKVFICCASAWQLNKWEWNAMQTTVIQNLLVLFIWSLSYYCLRKFNVFMIDGRKSSYKPNIPSMSWGCGICTLTQFTTRKDIIKLLMPYQNVLRQ